MRLTMRPVKLGRVVETCSLARNYSKINEEILMNELNVSKRRAREILLEIVRMNLLNESKEGFYLTEIGLSLLDAVRTEKWVKIHQIMLNYPYYAEYYRTIKAIGPMTEEEIISNIDNNDIHINKTTIDVLGDWAERIGSVQRNVFSGKYYIILNQEYDLRPFLFSNYESLNQTAGVALRQRYVEIPRLREEVCERYNLSREGFDKSLLEIYKRNIGTIEFSGAPEITHAKKSQKKVKKTYFSELPYWVSMKLTSEQYLSGVRLGSKQYYYIAIHGRDIE